MGGEGGLVEGTGAGREDPLSGAAGGQGGIRAWRGRDRWLSYATVSLKPESQITHPRLPTDAPCPIPSRPQHLRQLPH